MGASIVIIMIGIIVLVAAIVIACITGEAGCAVIVFGGIGVLMVVIGGFMLVGAISDNDSKETLMGFLRSYVL